MEEDDDRHLQEKPIRRTLFVNLMRMLLENFTQLVTQKVYGIFRVLLHHIACVNLFKNKKTVNAEVHTTY